jgi:hypothetical protein
LPTPLFDGGAEQIAHLAIQKRMPTLYFSKEAVKVGILPILWRASGAKRISSIAS